MDHRCLLLIFLTTIGDFRKSSTSHGSFSRLLFATGKFYGQDSEKCRFLWTKFSSNNTTLVGGQNDYSERCLKAESRSSGATSGKV